MNLQHSVTREKFVLLVAVTVLRDVLRSASMRHGEQYAMTPGMDLMQTLRVDSWDIQDLVNCFLRFN